MKVGFDTSPLSNTKQVGHKVRGAGFYITHLQEALINAYTPDNFVFFSNRKTNLTHCDIIHYPYFDPFFLTLPFNMSKKYIVTVHDVIPLLFKSHFPIGVKGRIKWEVQKMLLQKAAAIITDSNSSKTDILQFISYQAENIYVIPLAAAKEYQKVNDTRAMENVTKKYELPEKFVLYVGDVTWNKNLPRLLESLKNKDVPLVMVGSAISQKQIDRKNAWNHDLTIVQEMIKNNKNIHTLGFIPTQDLNYIYNLATLSVLPSLYEGFGLTILEAMNASCPVVTTHEGSIPEVAGKAAFYVDPHSETSIWEGIEQVYNSQQLQKELSQKGLKQASKFSWDKTAKETMDLYHLMCEK